MKGNGKKMFPGKNNSNIFFVENKNNSKINPNKFINKNHKPIKDINNNIISNKNNIIINSNDLIKNNRNRNKSSEVYNSNKLKKMNNTISANNNYINRRKVLYTERSVDCLKKKRVLGNFSATTYLLNKNDIWKTHNRNSIDNIHNSTRYKPLKTFSSFSQKEIEDDFSPKTNRKKSSKIYYNKFINKQSLIDNKKLSNRQIIKNRKNNNIPPPKEQTFIIKKTKLDNNLIDIKDLKKKCLENGINVISLTGLSTSLEPIDNDSVKLILNSKDINSNKFNEIEKYIQKKGLKLNEVKNNYHIKYTRGIYPNKAHWDDLTYGGREKFEKSEISSKFQKAQSKGKFHKKNILSKTNFYKDVKYKNNSEIKPIKNKSVEK